MDHRDSREKDEYPPPPFFARNAPQPMFSPPPPHAYYISHMGPGPGPIPDSYLTPPPPADHQPQLPHFPLVIDHHAVHAHQVFDELSSRPTVRMFCKAEINYSLAVRDGQVILSRSNPSDLSQHWVKDEKLSTNVKDEEGFPSFALINKTTGYAMKHSFGATHPVQLTRHESNGLDESVLWTQGRDLGDGYRAIRMVNNIRLNVDAFVGDKSLGGVHDGTKIGLWEWNEGDNQRWKIERY